MSESIPYFNDELPAVPDFGYDLWPSDPFGSPVVRLVIRLLSEEHRHAWGRPAGVYTFPDLVQEVRERVDEESRYRDKCLSEGREYPDNPVADIEPREAIVVWAIRNLIAQGQVTFIHDQVPQHLIDREDRGQWLELFCLIEREKETRKAFALPPRMPISAKRPRATLALSDTRAAVWAMTDGHCWYCGIKTNPFDDFCIDHVRPIALGGADEIENLAPACTRCNRDKGKLTVEAFRSVRAQWVGVKPEGYSFYFERMGYRP